MPAAARRRVRGRWSAAMLMYGLAAMLAARFELPWPVALYAAMSAVTFIAYSLDKTRAVRGQWRISEWTMHLLELCFGWPGAFIAQRFFRHKLRKREYMAVFWLIVLVHLVFWGWYLGWLRPG